MTTAALLQAWSEFWFKKESPAAICVFRICIGLLTLYSAFTFIPDSAVFFGPGPTIIEPVGVQGHWGNRFSFIMHPKSNMDVTLILGGLVIASAFMTVGFLTRVSGIAMFLLIVSLVHRQPVIMNSSDTLLRLCALFLAFSPANKMYSVDAWIGKKFFDKKASEDEPVLAEHWVQRMFQLQIALIYCSTFFYKLNGDTWLNGTAVYFATRLIEFSRLPLPFVFDNAFTVALFTYGALFIEFSMFTLVWIKDLRYKVLLVTVIFHLGIEWTMNVPVFEWLMMACLLNFVDGKDVESFLHSIKLKLSNLFSENKQTNPSIAP